MGRDLAERRGAETAVYQPAEDSALLAGAVVDGVRERDRGAADLALDVGTGSGYVAERLATETDARVVATDPNPHACRAARDRLGDLDDAGPVVAVARADLVGPFRDDSVDVVAFNPPYLPTDPDAEWDDWMERALSGGESGRAVIEPFLATVGRVLAPGGVAYLLASSLSGVDAVAELAGDAGFSAAVAAEESFPFETLVVLKLRR